LNDIQERKDAIALIQTLANTYDLAITVRKQRVKQEPFTCECGVTIIRPYHASHQRSVMHRHWRRLHALLSEECISYEEIGQRLGITRERVRQYHQAIAGTPGLGGQRRTVCTLRSRDQRWREIPDIATLLTTCPLPVVPILTSTPLGYALNTVTIMGQRCIIRHVSLTGPEGRYMAIHRSQPQNVGADFVLYLLPNDRGWLVIPRDRCPTRGTQVSLQPLTGGRGFTKHARHDWREYLNAWHLLGAVETKQESA